MKMRSRARMVVLSVLAASLCASGMADARTTIKFWTCFSGDYGKVLERICARFEKENPDIRVLYSCPASNGDVYVAKILAAVAGGAGPDMVWTVPEWMVSLYDRMVVPLPTLQKLGGGLETSRFYRGLVEPRNHYKGTLYGIPFENSNMALFYNKSLFAAAGLPEAPKTWDELTQYALKLTRKETKQFGIDTFFPNWFMPMFYAQKGVQIIDGNKINFDAKAGIEAVTWFTDLQTKHKVNGTGFLNGKAAMSLLGGWDYPGLVKAKKVNFGIAPLPIPEGGMPSSLITFKELAILKNGDMKKVAAAWQLARYILSDDVFVEWCMATGYLPVTRSQAAVPAYKRYLDNNPGLEVMVDQTETGCMMPVVRGSLNIWAALQQALDAIGLGKKSVGQALAEANKAAQAFAKAK